MFRSGGRGFLYAIFAFAATASAAPPDLGQGWSAADREFFYYTTQGSQLIRRVWFLALERHDSEELFLADGLARFGYLPGQRGSLNPDGLPIGFAVDPPTTKEWIGMTCAACHTGEITYRGATLRIDGAPASADMYEFLAKLDLALRKAARDDAAFARFAVRVLGSGDTTADRAELRGKLAAFSAGFAKFVSQSTPASPWGPARVDAFGLIFNRVTSIDLGNDANSRPPNAPVSYPFLWGTSWHDFTQWNGAVANDNWMRRLSRNVGQVLGVFGTIDLKSGPFYRSSAQRTRLIDLEDKVSMLAAPAWPEALFGAPDKARVARGEVLYREYCSGCHALVPRENQQRFVRVTRVAVTKLGTDEAMTQMAANRRSATGFLEGRRLGFFPGRRMGAEELSADLLSHAVIGVMTLINVKAKPDPELSKSLFDSTLVIGNYKARPLNGIWATGPYLHNGSVRTLYQLLLPPAEREARFYVGSREFDPVEVGFANAPGIAAFELDTSVPGNYRSGHLYGTAFSGEQRRDLVEYMKTL